MAIMPEADPDLSGKPSLRYAEKITIFDAIPADAGK
jgi:hypothetical protein